MIQHHRFLDMLTWGSAIVTVFSLANMALVATVFAGVVSGVLGIIRIRIAWRDWKAGR